MTVSLTANIDAGSSSSTIWMEGYLNASQTAAGNKWERKFFVLKVSRHCDVNSLYFHFRDQTYTLTNLVMSLLIFTFSIFHFVLFQDFEVNPSTLLNNTALCLLDYDVSASFSQQFVIELKVKRQSFCH